MGRSKIDRKVILEFIDAQSMELFWQGTSDSSYDTEGTPEYREAQLKAVVDKLLNKYPPKTK